MNIIFPRQLRRLPFCIRLGFFLLLPPLSRPLFRILRESSPDVFQDSVFRSLLTLLCVVLTLYILIFVVVPRVRDIGMSPLAGLLSLIPLINILFLLFILFAPSGWRLGIATQMVRPMRPPNPSALP